MECNFFVGQKVVVIKRDDLTEREIKSREAARRAGVTFPDVGIVYTIRDVYSDTFSNGEVVVGVHLVEILNDPRMKFSNGRIGEIGFSANCFRPIVVRKTDISIFKAMLNPSKEQVSA
jgi:hypothetical protein